MSEDHNTAAPELDAPSLGQGPPPERKVHHLVADDLVVDLAELFLQLSQKAAGQLKEKPK